MGTDEDEESGNAEVSRLLTQRLGLSRALLVLLATLVSACDRSPPADRSASGLGGGCDEDEPIGASHAERDSSQSAAQELARIRLAASRAADSLESEAAARRNPGCALDSQMQPVVR